VCANLSFLVMLDTLGRMQTSCNRARDSYNGAQGTQETLISFHSKSSNLPNLLRSLIPLSQPWLLFIVREGLFKLSPIN